MEYKLLITASMLIVIAILVIAIILLLANLGAYFTKIAQGSTVFISVGESLKKSGRTSVVIRCPVLKTLGVGTGSSLRKMKRRG